MKLVNDYLNM